MLILSNSMCKSASTIIWWYKNELINRTTPVNGNRGLADFIDSGAVSGEGCFVNDPLEDQAVDRMMEFAAQNGPTVVKAHCYMTPYLSQMIGEGKILATFAYRDPRDVILSAIDCRNREIKSGSQVRFPGFSSVEAAIPLIQKQCVRAEPWIVHPKVLKMQYRDTVANPNRQIHSLAKALGVQISDTQVEEILKIEAENKSGQSNWMEFSQAKLTRYPTEMSPAQIELCNRELGRWIEKFGYSIEESCSSSAVPIDSSAA